MMSPSDIAVRPERGLNKRISGNIKDGTGTDHLAYLTFLTLFLRLLTLLLAFLTSYLPQFDSSSSLILPINSLLQRAVSVTLRWDAFHFIKIAENGYVVEQLYAFMPGVPGILKAGGWLVQSMTPKNIIAAQPSITQMVVPHFLISTLFSLSSTRTLYELTLHCTNSPQFALLTAYLSLLPSSPATLHLSPYTEGWYTWGSYLGMLYCARRQWVPATLAFMFAGLFRANAILLGGFTAWGMLIQPIIEKRRISPFTVICCLLLSFAPSIPFLLHQLHAYVNYCAQPVPDRRPWCDWRIPFIYPFVQSHYWNVGFLRYWEVAQIPNFIIAAPVLVLLFWGSATAILTAGRHALIQAGLVDTRTKPNTADQSNNHMSPDPSESSPSVNAEVLLPHAIHALILTLSLFLSAHTQIVLRLAASMPFTYWSAARLVVERRHSWGRAWITWSIVWGLVSIVLWTSFLPPA